jgi:plasmid stabilization system protein ParE
MARFVLSEDAEVDLQEIKIYLLREGGTPLVRHIFAKLTASIKMLAANPYIGHIRTDLTDEAVRFWSVFSYLIVYDPQTKPLGIARILHGSQDLERLFMRTPPRF